MDRLVADIPIKTPVTSAVKKQKRKKRKKVSVLYMLGTSNITLSLWVQRRTASEGKKNQKRGMQPLLQKMRLELMVALRPHSKLFPITIVTRATNTFASKLLFPLNLLLLIRHRRALWSQGPLPRLQGRCEHLISNVMWTTLLLGSNNTKPQTVADLDALNDMFILFN